MAKYTRRQHLAMAALLRKAKPLLWDGVAREYQPANICGALMLAAEPNTNAARQRLQSWIAEQLRPYNYYTSWLYWNCPAYKALEDGGIPWRERCAKAQATRLAWIDHMIAVLEAP